MEKKYAYVTVLYGTNVYLTGALVLAYSLIKSQCKYDRVIMVTPDVSQDHVKLLAKLYDYVVNIDYVDVNNNIFSDENTRFINVFTKLRCFELVHYDKILLMDLDMLVINSIDHLFDLDAPAACIKHHSVDYGEKIDSQLICDNRNNKLVGSINAGLMLLTPDLVEWHKIMQDIKENESLHKFKYPEQDYLSLRYCKRWTSITFNYNFQFGLTNRVRKSRYNIDDIYVIHYSSQYKPWNWFIQGWTADASERKFISIHRKYYGLWTSCYNLVKAYLKKAELFVEY